MMTPPSLYFTPTLVSIFSILPHTPAEADAEGVSFTFEKGAKKTGGGDGFADVWKLGFFAWEYKGKRKSLQEAYQQLLQYREDLANPKLLVVCDMDRFEVHTNFTDTVTQVHRFSTADLTDPKTLEILQAVFFKPETLRPGQTPNGLTEAAAAEFARLADMLRVRGVPARDTAHFLVKVVFCLFAEDVGLLPKGHFARIVEKTGQRPKEFVRYTHELFAAMAKGGTSLLEDIPYFNGNLFSDGEVLELKPEEMDFIREAARFDWSDVEPAIFGTLFERSLDPAKRSKIGAHYTHPDDIRAVVEPVLMAPLRREWEEVRQRVSDLSDRLPALKGPSAVRIRRQMEAALLGFLHRLSSVRILDPACGSGNFLYVSMNLLKDLEKEVITFAGKMGLTLPLYQVTPEQLHGLEVNTYARELAQTAIWIGYIKWHEKNRFPVQRNPILQPLDTIREMDAILDLTDPAHPREPDWPDADVIVGNPPFLGDKRMRRELDNQYVDALRALYVGRIPGQSDLVCYWFEKARAMVETGRVKRVGLLATQGIRGGANRRVLERIKQTGDIFWAESDRVWMLDGATVHVSMVGFDSGVETNKVLDGKPVTTINADLTTGIDLTVARPLKENQGISFIGVQRTGPFELTREQADKMLLSVGNPNGRPNADVIKPWINALDLTQRPRDMWIIDFGTDMSKEDAAKFEEPFEYVKAHVKPVRDTVRRQNHKKYWWLFGEARPGMRNAISGLKRYVITPLVSKHRLFAWTTPNVMPENLLIAIAKDDDYTFGVLHSSVHEVWSRAMGTQLRDSESATRYTPSSTFITFPFPRPTPEQQAAIAAAAKELNALRQAWLNPPGASEKELKPRTLTNLYNARPTWLAQAHERLDNAVRDAYGWPYDIAPDDLLARLLALNLAREPVNSDTRGAIDAETDDAPQ